MAVSKRTRYEVLRRDDHTCRYCGESAPDVKITVDHVTPTALGGSDKPDNLVAACKDCNAGKSSVQPGSDLVDDVKQTDIRWAAAIRQAADIRAAQRAGADDYIDRFVSAWQPRYLPNNFASTLQSLYESGLPEVEMLDAVGIAFSARDVESRFRYFCGVAWRKVGVIQEMAKALLAVSAEEVAD